MRLCFSAEAKADLVQIWQATADRWSISQADNYREHLTTQIRALCDTPTLGRPVAGHPELRSMSFNRGRNRDGHLVVYRIDEAERQIVILRFFHTKQNWPEQI